MGVVIACVTCDVAQAADVAAASAATAAAGAFAVAAAVSDALLRVKQHCLLALLLQSVLSVLSETCQCPC